MPTRSGYRFDMARTFIIAELGSSWLYGPESDQFEHGRELARAAIKAGADAIKVQWVSDSRAMARRRKMKGDPYRHLAWPGPWHLKFRALAHGFGAEYISTVFLPQDVGTLWPIVDRFKIASLEARSPSLLQAVLAHRNPVLISTGCMTDVELVVWLNSVSDEDLARMQVLHCVAAYPAETLNLRYLQQARRLTGVSDHSCDEFAGALSVAAGATIIEVHCRLTTTPTGNPDYPHSLTIEQLRRYITRVRWAERMMGSGTKEITKAEQKLMTHRVLA